MWWEPRAAPDLTDANPAEMPRPQRVSPEKKQPQNNLSDFEHHGQDVPHGGVPSWILEAGSGDAWWADCYIWCAYVC